MNNREVSHLWAAQSRERAKGSSFYFEGATIYSYGPHFPIARIHSHATRGRFVLFTTRDYRVTTAKHKGYAYSAVSHLPVVAVPDINPGNAHADNLAYMAAGIKDCATSAMRRTREDGVQHDAERASRLHKAMADYMTFFGIRRKMIPMPGFADAFERARRIENPDPASADKRERAKAQRKAAAEVKARKAAELAAVRQMAYRTDWRLGGAFGLTHSHSFTGMAPIMLRVNGEQIETSLGARIPLAAAPMVWNMVQRARRSESGLAPCNIGADRRPRIGDYPLDRIDADGTLHAGCHTIPYSELSSMARALGLVS